MTADARPRLLDLFCGAGGAAMGYAQAGFRVVGVDLVPQKHYPFQFIQADALEFLDAGGWRGFDAIHASPPCQGYSVMNNLPWFKGREYPLLILPVLEALEHIGLPYVLENVMGARHKAKGLTKRGLEAHGLKAGWLCGMMFGKPFYRHRLFATPFLWLAPEHPQHQLNLHPRAEQYVYGGTVKGLPGGMAGMDVKPRDPFHDAQGRSILDPGNMMKGAGLRQYTRSNGKVEIVTKTGTTEPGYGLTQWQNGAQAEGCGVGHAKGWRKAAEMMEVTWCDRAGLTQAVPPCYTRFIGEQLLKVLG